MLWGITTWIWNLHSDDDDCRLLKPNRLCAGNAFKIINKTFRLSLHAVRKGRKMWFRRWSNGIMNKIKFVCLHNSFNYGSMWNKSASFRHHRDRKCNLRKRIMNTSESNRCLSRKIGYILSTLRPLMKVCFYCGFSSSTVCWTTLNKTLDLTVQSIYCEIAF